MRKRTLYFITLVTLFLSANVFVSNVLSQTNLPFTLEQIQMALASRKRVSKIDKKAHYSEILDAIRQRKVDFPLTKENEELLRKEGATDEFIEVIRQNSLPLVMPTLAATPNSSTSSQILTSTSKSDWLKDAQRGDDFLKKHDYDQAIIAYNKALEINPQNSAVLVLRGFSYHYKGNGRQAVTDYVSAAKVNPELSDEPYIKCLIQTTFGDYADLVIENCSKAITEYPSVALYYFKRGLAYQGVEDYKESIADFDKAIELNPKFLLAYSSLGASYFEMHNYEQAIDKYNKVLELDSQNTNALIQRVYARRFYGDSHNKFVADYNSAIQINPVLASEPSMVCIRFNSGDEANLDKVIVFAAKHKKGLFDEDEANLDKVIENCNKAITEKTKFSLLYYVRSSAYWQKKDFDSVIIDLNKTIEIDPNFTLAYYARGGFFSSVKGNCKQAIIDYTKAIELSPKWYGPYNNRGICYFKSGDYYRALNDYNKAIEIDPKIPKAYNNRAMIYGKLGQKNLAEQDQKRARELEKAIEANIQLNRNSSNPSIVSGGFVGQVSDKNKKPIPGVTVTITNKNTGVSVLTKTDEKGAFSRNGLPPGKYRIQLSAVGYKTITTEQTIFATHQTLEIYILEKEENSVVTKPPR